MTEPEISEVTEGKAKKRKFDRSDLAVVADFIWSEYDRRKRARADKERLWDEVDRQVAMRPSLHLKRDANGQSLPDSGWIPELELPLQAQALEVLTADSRRLLFPENGDWFKSFPLVSDKYLAASDMAPVVAGDDVGVPVRMDVDGVAGMVEGVLNSFEAQYDFRGEMDKMLAEAKRYGTMVGRARLITKTAIMNTARGIVPEQQKFPALCARSIRNTYLDDCAALAMAEGMALSPSTIEWRRVRVQDLIVAATKGGKGFDDYDGGWMPGGLADIKGDDAGMVDVLEFEGDLIVPRKTVESFVIENVCVTVVKGNGKPVVCRMREGQAQGSTYVVQPYHLEGLGIYGVGPLEKGAPIQKAATESFTYMIMAGLLSVLPPVKWDQQDPRLAAQGGPRISPRALWNTMAQVEPVKIGDIGAILPVYQSLLQQYSDLVGVNPARLGAQTVSHTSAYAKSVELQQGAGRTVDFISSVKANFLHRWLHLAYQMTRQVVKKPMDIYSREMDGWITVGPDNLPEKVEFLVMGADAPADAREETIKKANALQLATQLDQAKVQLGGQPLDYDAIQREILKEGGFQNVERFLSAPVEAVAPGPADAAILAGGGIPSSALTQYPASAGNALVAG